MNDRNESDLTIPYVKVGDYYFPKSNVTFIAQLMGISRGALAGAFLAPFLYGLYWKRTSRIAVWTSFIFSSVVMLANMLVKSAFPPILQSPINAGAFCMIAGLIMVPVISLITSKLPQDHLAQVRHERSSDLCFPGEPCRSAGSDHSPAG